jgi:hypothetical protein
MSTAIQILGRNAMLAAVLCLAGSTPTVAQAVYPAPGQMTGPGVLPPAVSSVTYPGDVIDPAYNYERDLGFSGVVNGVDIWTFGDTLLGGAFCSSDSSAVGALNIPGYVYDKNIRSGGYTNEWIPLDSQELANGGLSDYSEGGTNVVEYAPNKGLVWFLKDYRPNGIDNIQGAGVCTVTATASGGAVATRTMDTMWNSWEPYWGDIGVTYNPLDGDVYVFGHGPASANLKSCVYLAKVPASQATNVGAYQYWDQSAHGWTTTRFANGQLGTINVSSAQAIFTNNSQGQSNAFWSNYYNCWMFVYGADVGYTDIMVRTAPALQGPWTTGFTIASTCPTGTCSGERYAICPHPEYDLSGKTLLVSWTDSNVIHLAKITWK